MKMGLPYWCQQCWGNTLSSIWYLRIDSSPIYITISSIFHFTKGKAEILRDDIPCPAPHVWSESCWVLGSPFFKLVVVTNCQTHISYWAFLIDVVFLLISSIHNSNSEVLSKCWNFEETRSLHFSPNGHNLPFLSPIQWKEIFFWNFHFCSYL